MALEVVALAAASSPPALSESSESHVRSFRATRDRVGPNAAGRPRRGGLRDRRRSYDPSRIRVERAVYRSTNLATSQLASSIRFQVRDRLSFKFVNRDRHSLRFRVASFSRLWPLSFKFVIASNSESLRLRSRVFGSLALRRVSS